MWPLITAKSLIFSSGIVAWLPFIVPFPGNSSKQTKRPKSKRLKHSTFITCSIILFSSVKQLTLAFDDYEKKWQQNQRNLHDFEITFKKEIKIWLLHGSVTFKRAHSFGHLRGIPGAACSWAQMVLPLMAYTGGLRPKGIPLFHVLGLWKGRDFVSWTEYIRE